MLSKKVVYNACFGGFSLSPAGIKRYAELCGRECYLFTRRSVGGEYVPVDVDNADGWLITAFDIPNPNEVIPGDEHWGAMSEAERRANNAKFDQHHICGRSLKRDDPRLVQVIEELGDKANGQCAKLKIATVPVGSKYRIDEYDGFESVKGVDDYNWQTA